MNDYNYHDAVYADIKDYILCNNISLDDDRDEVYERLYDDLWNEDCVTGNASGSYTFNTYTAEEYLCHNYDLLLEALDEFGMPECNPMEKGAEWCDVCIRCYILADCLNAVLDELYESKETC